MQYILDTNIVSYYLRRTSQRLETKLDESLMQQSCVISVITRAELKYGQLAMQLGDARSQLINQFIAKVPNLAWEVESADAYAKLKVHLRNQGTAIGELDTQIAAHALATGLTLITHNTKHFERVAGLKMEDWTVE